MMKRMKVYSDAGGFCFHFSGEGDHFSDDQTRSLSSYLVSQVYTSLHTSLHFAVKLHTITQKSLDMYEYNK